MFIYRHFFPITTKHGSMLDYLNYRIAQSETFVTVDQTEHTLKMAKKYFSRAPFAKTDIPSEQIELLKMILLMHNHAARMN